MMNRHCRGSGHWHFLGVDRLVVLLTTVLPPLLAGCGGPPQVEGHNREIVTSLATAVSARDQGWLEQNARLIERRKSEGELSDQEYEVFNRIVAQAKAGDWDKAERAVYGLREAQRPSSEDRENAARRKLAPEHGQPKKAAGAGQPKKTRREP